jgi:predicted DNA-binding transcriptional regulator AlpA
MDADKDVITTKELCDRLKISRQTLHAWRSKDIMPRPLATPGKRGMLRWKWSEIENWLRSSDRR